MSEEFDPYHRWLGIHPRHQPANHYRLLGLELFEDDPEVIRDAAERQIGHVRRYAMGQHAGLSQRILNELAAAKACLLDQAKKAEYDQELREEVAAEEEQVLPTAEPEREEPRPPIIAESTTKVAIDVGEPLSASRRRSGGYAGRRRRGHPRWWASPVGIGAVVVGAFVLLVLLLGSRFLSHPKPAERAITTSDDTEPIPEPPPSPTSLVLSWPISERGGSKLWIDDVAQPVPDEGDSELRIPVEPGMHSVRAEREGFEPIDLTNLELFAGHSKNVRLDWNPIAKQDTADSRPPEKEPPQKPNPLAKQTRPSVKTPEKPAVAPKPHIREGKSDSGKPVGKRAESFAGGTKPAEMPPKTEAFTRSKNSPPPTSTHGSSDGAAQVIEANSVLAHPWEVYGLAFSPDGRKLATGGDRAVKLWDVLEGKERHELRAEGRALKFSPDGKMLLAGMSRRKTVFDTESGRAMHKFVRNSSDSVDFVGGTSWVIYTATRGAGEDFREVLILDPRSSQVKAEVIAKPRGNSNLYSQLSGIRSVTCSRDGKVVAVFRERHERQIILWDLRKRSHIATLSDIDMVEQMEFSADSTRLVATFSGGNRSVWDVATGERTGGMKGRCQLVHTIDGRTLLARCSLGGDVVLLDVADGTQGTYTIDGRVPMALSPGGQSVAALDGRKVVMVDLAGRVQDRVIDVGRAPHELKTVERVRFGPNGKMAAILGDGRMRVLLCNLEESPDENADSILGGAEESSAQTQRQPRLERLYQLREEWSNCTVISPDCGMFLLPLVDNEMAVLWLDPNVEGNVSQTAKITPGVHLKHWAILPRNDRIVGADDESQSQILLWDAPTGEEISRSRVPFRIRGIAVSPDGRKLAMACEGGATSVAVCDISDTANITWLPSRSDEIFRVRFSEDGQKVLAEEWEQIYGWELSTDKDLFNFALRRNRRDRSMHKFLPHAISRDFKYLVTQDASRDELVLYDLRGGRKLGVLAQTSGEISKVAFSPDGDLVAFGDWKGTHLVDVVNRQVLDTAPIRERLLVKFSSNGDRLLIGRTIWAIRR